MVMNVANFVYNDVATYSTQRGSSSVDPACETFVDAGMFCWNSILIEEHLTCRRYKCLGHSVGSNELSGVPQKQVITYADTSVGLVREQSEALFLQLKQVISEIPVPGDDSSIAMRMGFIDNAYFVSGTLAQKSIRSKALLFYWTHSKEPMAGISVYRRAQQLVLSAPRCMFLALGHQESSGNIRGGWITTVSFGTISQAIG